MTAAFYSQLFLLWYTILINLKWAKRQEVQKRQKGHFCEKDKKSILANRTETRKAILAKREKGNSAK